MRVVTAGVDIFLDAVDQKGQCVHIGTQHQHRAGFSAFDLTDNAGAANVAGNFIAQCF